MIKNKMIKNKMINKITINVNYDGGNIMKKYISVILSLVLLFLITGCDTLEESKAMVPSKQDSRVTTANNTFAFNIFKELNGEDLENNVFISPLSISEALAMTYNGAEGSTKEEIAEALAFGDLTKDEVNSGFKYVNQFLDKVDDKIQLEVANSLWIREGETINQDFIDLNKDAFNAMVESLDFSNENASNTINRWIDQSTNGLINQMIEPPIDDDVLMYLINAIYFNGKWTDPFDAERTADISFNNGLEKRTVEMMRRKGTVPYMVGDNYKAVKLYYGNKKTSMTCILPNEDVDINTFIDSMDQEKWNKIQEELTEEEDVILNLPKFKMEYGIKELNESLKSLGMEEAFEFGADFSGISDELFISRVLHKAVIEVNEEGSEAAGATVVEMKLTSAAEPKSFVADRPFIFVISDEDMGNILFMGKAFDL